MKKLISLFAVICMVLTLQVNAYNGAVYMPDAGKPAKNSQTTTLNQYGRFTVTSVGIDVALYNSSTQATCDAVDSACFFNYNGMIIADHNYQEFKKLYNVIPGMTGTIVRPDGGTITIQCVEMYNGHNTKSLLTDNDYNSVMGTHDILTYTCLDNCQNILICQWDVIDAQNITAQFDKQFNVDSTFLTKVTNISNSHQTAAPSPNTDSSTTTKGNGNKGNNGNNGNNGNKGNNGNNGNKGNKGK